MPPKYICDFECMSFGNGKGSKFSKDIDSFVYFLRVCCVYIHQLINSKHKELGVFPFHKIKCLEMVQFKDLLIVRELHDMDKITKFPWQALLDIHCKCLQGFTGSECWDFKFMGIACIPAIPVIFEVNTLCGLLIYKASKLFMQNCTVRVR